MLPSHLPLAALETLIKDHSRLTESESDEHTPLEMLIGYYEGGEYGGMPIENPESDETEPMKRLKEGERLAIQLHLGMLQDGCTFIDGSEYTPTEPGLAQGSEADDEEGEEDLPELPDETGFFGVGIWLDGDRLGLEPVCIGGSVNGDICVSKAVFRQSLEERAAEYLKKLA